MRLRFCTGEPHLVFRVFTMDKFTWGYVSEGVGREADVLVFADADYASKATDRN